MVLNLLSKILCFLFFLAVWADAEAQGFNDSTSKLKAWRAIADDTVLTYTQITGKCDSFFSDVTDTGENSQHLQYSRWKSFWRNRLDVATGKPYNINEDIKARVISGTAWNVCAGESPLQTSIGSITANGQGWHFIGPKNVIAAPRFGNQTLGRVSSMSVNPANHNEAYIANEWGGLWYCNDLSAQEIKWTCLTDNDPLLSGIGVLSFAVDYSTSPHRIFMVIGYGSHYLTLTGTQSLGLFVSNDGGVSYHRFSLSGISAGLCPVKQPLLICRSGS